MAASPPALPPDKKARERRKLEKRSLIKKDLKRNKYIYLLALPVIAYYAIFHYGPMYGLLMAFKDYSIADGIWGSKWIGFDHFKNFSTATTSAACFAIRS